MAEIVVSAVITVLSEKITSAALKKLFRRKGIDAKIEKCEEWLNQIQDVLTDASQKENSNRSVKRWLNDLQHLAYDMDDVLDELATEAMHREFTHKPEAITSKVRKLIPICCMNISQTHDKLNYVTAKLHDLVEKKNALGLVVKEETRSVDRNRRLQTSIVDVSSVVGRQAEKDALVRKLLGDEPCDRNFSIVPIVGMGGVGKTTLARLLYDDEQVKDHFELKAWVCVSDEFDSFAISKVIFQAITGGHKEFADLNLLQEDLEKHLRKKRFLLVLDDVWSESCQDWDTLVGPFRACALGSKIIMTTRKDKLLQVLGYTNLNQLRSLPHDDSLSLLASYALGVNNFDSHLSLKPYGEGVVEKCDGLPLALKALGRLLCSKQHEEEWKKVLDNEIWALPIEDEIIPALRLSYYDLPARLKRLFAYCSLFPKDCVFDREELVQLWMAEGFLHDSTQSNLTEECLGHEYFDELLSRSFFQHAPDDKSFYVMHDMMSDLATSVAGDFYLRLEKDIKNEGLEKYRHMSFVREEYAAYNKFEVFKRAKSLRTFLATSVGVVESWRSFYFSNKILVELLPELPLLRVLSLSRFRLNEVPECIGSLKHLRYLNLSQTKIEHLPENVCNLYNLQTLILFGCNSLKKLPNNFLKLKNLMHLDIRDTPCLKKLPLGVGELKALQTLSKFVIRDESGTEITRLGDLNNLCGKIAIEGLEKVQNARHAQIASISQKRLSELEFVWSHVLDGSRNEMHEKEVLNELKPGAVYLKQLKIMSYGGFEFPSWVGDPSFIHLKHVSISGCERCTSLPPLGQLPKLKELFIQGLKGVKVVGLEFLGRGSSFASLEVLSFKSMAEWERWSTSGGLVVFPFLKKFVIDDCPNLVEVSHEALPSLNVLHINGCGSVVLSSLIQVASTITELKLSRISGLNDVALRSVTKDLGAVEDLSITFCQNIRYLWESEAVASKAFGSLRNLTVCGCNDLLSLGEREEDEDDCRSNLLRSLRMLKIEDCKSMERCSCPDSIETFEILNCSSITTILLPRWRRNLKRLVLWGCDKLMEGEWGGQKMLEYVWIWGWTNLKSITKLNHLLHLTSLTITDCESMESFPDNEFSNLILLKHLWIYNCPNMDVSFPRGIWPPNLNTLGIGGLKKPISEWGSQNFPTSLVHLRLFGRGDNRLTSCSQLSHLLPSSLTSLDLDGFEQLKTFSITGVQHLPSLKRLNFENCQNLNKLTHPQNLTSLQHLRFYFCPNMMDLPEMLLPSLLSLRIFNSPKLEERYGKTTGSYWPLISHIPDIYI